MQIRWIINVCLKYSLILKDHARKEIWAHPSYAKEYLAALSMISGTVQKMLRRWLDGA